MPPAPPLRLAPAFRIAHPAPAPASGTDRDRRPLGQILLEMGAVEPGALLKAVAMRARQEARLGDILLTHGAISEADLMAALSLQWGARVVDPVAEPPDPGSSTRSGRNSA